MIELVVIAIRTFISDGFMLVIFLGYPHYMFVSINYLILFYKNIDLRRKLSEIIYIHWLVFGLVIAELIYEIMITFNQLNDSTRTKTFGYKIMSNFLIVLIFFPAILNFMIMRDVSKKNLVDLAPLTY